jgi:undecaprenyl-diphosphatase
VTDRLVSPRYRPAVVAVVAVCTMVTVVLGARFADTYEPGRLDQVLDLRIRARLAEHHHLLAHLKQLGDPVPVALLTLLLAVICVLRRRWRGLTLSVIGVAVSVALTELVLKPLVGRHTGHALAFPSGHTTGAFALATTAAVLLLQRGTIRLHISLRLLLAAMSLLLAGGVAVAVVGLGYHYTTDAVGGFCVALGTVLALAIAIDLVADWHVQQSASSRKRR